MPTLLCAGRRFAKAADKNISVAAGRRMYGWLVKRIAFCATVALAISAAACSRHGKLPADMVLTAEGPIQGIVTADHREFLGIPYAAPPVGDLRWRAPQPHAAWSTPLKANHAPPSCPQLAGANPFGDENCLYLNVYTPSPPPGSPRPVMVWFYGGGFNMGDVNQFDGSLLAAKKNVIVVIPNYRLGPLGFLMLSVLDAEDKNHLSGNYGILDQQAALRWVRDNVSSFGGDPRVVTIFGASSGGMSVCAHLVSPASKGLFERAIIESGPCAYLNNAQNPPFAITATLAKSLATRLAAKLGCTKASELSACLRSKPAAAVVSALPIEIFHEPMWGPMIDGIVIPAAPLQEFAKGHFNKVPVINGSNHDEGTMAAYSGLAGLMKAAAPLEAADLYPTVIRAMFKDKADEILAHYPLSSYASPTKAYSTAGGDWFSCAARANTRALATQVPTFAYEFNDRKAPPFFSDRADPSFDPGAFHGGEVQYVFAVRFPQQLLPPLPQFSSAQRRLSDQMMDYWTEFAATGRPGGSDPAWASYDPKTDQVLSLAPEKIVFEATFVADHHCAFWDALHFP